MTATQVDHVSRTTLFWFLGVLIAAQVGVNAFMFDSMTRELSELETRTTTQMERLEQRIDMNQSRIDSVNNDIRAILVGIEQVKARLGIVESTRGGEL